VASKRPFAGRNNLRWPAPKGLERCHRGNGFVLPQGPITPAIPNAHLCARSGRRRAVASERGNPPQFLSRRSRCAGCKNAWLNPAIEWSMPICRCSKGQRLQQDATDRSSLACLMTPPTGMRHDSRPCRTFSFRPRSSRYATGLIVALAPLIQRMTKVQRMTKAR
jgi:hypothetical protein